MGKLINHYVAGGPGYDYSNTYFQINNYTSLPQDQCVDDSQAISTYNVGSNIYVVKDSSKVTINSNGYITNDAYKILTYKDFEIAPRNFHLTLNFYWGYENSEGNGYIYLVDRNSSNQTYLLNKYVYCHFYNGITDVNYVNAVDGMALMTYSGRTQSPNLVYGFVPTNECYGYFCAGFPGNHILDVYYNDFYEVFVNPADYGEQNQIGLIITSGSPETSIINMTIQVVYKLNADNGGENFCTRNLNESRPLKEFNLVQALISIKADFANDMITIDTLNGYTGNINNVGLTHIYQKKISDLTVSNGSDGSKMYHSDIYLPNLFLIMS